MISAVSQGNLGAVRMLVQAGTNINAIYEDSFTALGFAEQYEETEIIEYLHSLGALGSREALKKRKAERPSLLGRLASRFGFNQTETENSELICEFFEDRFCQSRPLDLPEMFGSKPRFDVHLIYPSAKCKNIVLFTNGLSAKRAQQYSPKVELYLELCPEWPSPAEDPAGAWPLEWLINIGEQVIKSKSGFDGNYVVVANGDPPEPFSEFTDYSCWLLGADSKIDASNAQSSASIQLYRLLPLYAEERDLELTRGSKELVNALRRGRVSKVIVPQRKNLG